MAEQDPGLRTRQPWQAADDKDYSWLSGVVTKHYQGDDGDVRVLGAGVLQPSPASPSAMRCWHRLAAGGCVQHRRAHWLHAQAR
jgi:hypothetical protein